MYAKLEEINVKPPVFSECTTESLWADDYRAKNMLSYHLNEDVDLSSYNHRLIGDAVRWMAQRFDLKSGSNVCDLGCGPGLYTNRLAALGANITGVDFSKNSIEYARDQASKQGLDVEYIYANYLDVTLNKQYDLITLIMCDYCALNPVQRQQLLSNIRESLSPDGKLLLDVHSTVFYDQKQECAIYEKNQLNHFWFEEDYYCYVNAYKYDDEKVLLDKYSIFTQSGKSETVYNWLQCFDVESLTREMAEAGLLVESVYSDIRGTDYASETATFAVVVRKDQ